MPKSISVKAKILLVLTVLILLFSSYPGAIKAGPAEDLAAVQKQLQDLKKRKEDINNAIKSEKNREGQYTNEISGVARERDLLEEEIKEKELVIKELNLQIEILTSNIASTEKVIEKTKSEIKGLEDEADVQLTKMYLDQKTYNNSISLIFTEPTTDFVKQNVYQRSIQDDTNSALTQLETENNKLKTDKTRLEGDKEKVNLDKSSLDKERVELDKKKTDLQGKLNRLSNLRRESQKSIESNKKAQASLSDQESKLLADQELLQQRLFNQISSVNNGTFVRKGTIIGQQGLTGLTTGYHLHFGVQLNGSYQNPCGYLPAGKFSFCAGNGSLSWPLQGSFAFTSGYGARNLGQGTSSFHAAIDIAHPTNNAPVYAAHDGYYVRGFSACSSTNSLCKSGGANYVILCENKANCNQGLKSLYWHLK